LHFNAGCKKQVLNPEKNLAQIRLAIFEKNTPLIPQNDVTDPTARLL